MSNSSLYDDDILLWSEQQARVIRDLGRRGRVPNDLDVENVAEEIETVGRNELAAVKSQLRQFFLHIIKLALEDSSEAAAHWRGEILGFHSELMTHYAPSMRQRVDVQNIWKLARRQSMLTYERENRFQPTVPDRCPFSLDELLAEDIDPSVLVQRLGGYTRPTE